MTLKVIRGIAKRPTFGVSDTVRPETPFGDRKGS